MGLPRLTQTPKPLQRSGIVEHITASHPTSAACNTVPQIVPHPPKRADGMRKRGKVKPRVDYRHRWPTQQTLIESRASLEAPTFEWQWRLRFRADWLRRLARRSSPEPGKSTHPYDTGVGGRESDSDPGSRSLSPVADPGCWRRLTCTPRVPTPPPPVPKFSHVREEPRPETPKTPIQFLRHLATPRKSPFPRSRTSTPLDADKPPIKFTRSRVQTPAPAPAPPPPPVVRPVVKAPKTLSARLRSLLKNMSRWQRPEKHHSPG
ncbi:hypothetical protein F4802DRAFT_204085 [Xylaria palmicola]|nr:hypothetical protein F4802DRAFT_204085 [Xylaria palmicola]